MRPMGIKHADRYLVVTLEEVVQVVPLTDRAACMVQSMPAALLEVVLTPAHQPAHALHASSLTLATQYAEQFMHCCIRNKLACNRLFWLVPGSCPMTQQSQLAFCKLHRMCIVYSEWRQCSLLQGA